MPFFTLPPLKSRVTSGSWTITTLGSSVFTVPNYNTLTVRVYGGGGQGLSDAFGRGASGADSSWNGTVIGTGGQAGWPDGGTPPAGGGSAGGDGDGGGGDGAGGDGGDGG